MDARHFDALARALTEAGTRRNVLALLTSLPVLGGLFWFDADEAAADGRRKRRVKKHKHGKGRRRKNKSKTCKADAKTTTCAGKCGSVTNNCQQAVDCGSCACDPACDPCYICESGPNTPGNCIRDPDQQGQPCGGIGKVCQPDGECACIPVDPCATHGVCGTVTDNCGQSVTCDPCPVVNSFVATPATIDRGATPPETTTLSWSTSNATVCVIDQGNAVLIVDCGDASRQLGAVQNTTYTLIARNATGAEASKQTTLTVEYCHAITAIGGTCPSGATEYCQAGPISATSSADARAACETCRGGECTHTFNEITGAGWVATGGGVYIYQSGTGPFCGNYTTQAGDITNFQDCFVSRWAP